MIRTWTLAAFVGLLATGALAETLVERLLKEYEAVQTLTCDLRRDNEAGADKMRFLSRIYYARPDRLHVENTAPIERTIVSDGTNFFSYIDGDPKGFSRPVDKLDVEMLRSLRKVPGTAMDHLLRLKDVPETELPATAEFPVRRGYDAGKVFAVLSMDASNRLARIEFYTAADQKNLTGQYDYSAFQEVVPGVWIPCLHQGVMRVAGQETRETTRVSNLSVNTPIAEGLFVPAPYFKGVEFVDSFKAIYEM